LIDKVTPIAFLTYLQSSAYWVWSGGSTITETIDQSLPNLHSPNIKAYSHIFNCFFQYLLVGDDKQLDKVAKGIDCWFFDPTQSSTCGESIDKISSLGYFWYPYRRLEFVSRSSALSTLDDFLILPLNKLKEAFAWIFNYHILAFWLHLREIQLLF